MSVKNGLKNMLQYIKDFAEDEDINLQETFAIMESFEYDEEKLSNEAIDAMSEEEAKSLLFDVNYVAINELFGGDFETWNYTLEAFGFDEETIDFLNY